MRRGFLNNPKAVKSPSTGKGPQEERDPSLETKKSPEDENKAVKFSFDPSSGWTLEMLQHTFVHHVVSASDGSTDCLLWGLEARKLIPKYPSSISNSPTPPYVIRPTGRTETGLGMFATRDLQVGDLILCERPIFLLPRLLDSPYIAGPPTFYPPKKNPTNRAGWEAIFCPFFERISKEKQDEYLALENSHPEDGIGPLLGAFRTNNFEHCLDGADLNKSYCGTYKIMSRVNHSCAGNNSQSRFVTTSFSLEFRAIRDIKKDDEIFVSYCGDAPGTTPDRQKFLAFYGFQCDCNSCTSPVSDHLYLKILSSHQNLDKSYEAWLKDLTLADDHIIKPSLVWTSLIEQQGIPVMEIYIRHLRIILMSFIALGDLENSMKHGTKVGRISLAMTGSEALANEYTSPNFYLLNKDFGTRRRVGQAKKGKGKGKGKGARGAA